MISPLLKCITFVGLLLILPTFMISANPIEKVDTTKHEQAPVEEKNPSSRYDIIFGIFAPYSTIGSDFNGSKFERVDMYRIIMPEIDGKMGWGGTIGLRMSNPGEWVGCLEMGYYRATHDYIWSDTVGEAILDAFSIELNASYPRFPIQPLLFFGASLVGVKVKNGAEDNLSNISDADHFGVDLKFGAGFNLKVNDYLWLSSRIGYRRYWFHTVRVNDDNHGFDELQKSNGFWLTVGLYTGFRIK